jgi:hypothetical protein
MNKNTTQRPKKRINSRMLMERVPTDTRHSLFCLKNHLAQVELKATKSKPKNG